MQKLFLVALVVGVCAPAIMAQDPAKAGIYGGLQNLRSNAPETSKQDVSSLPRRRSRRLSLLPHPKRANNMLTVCPLIRPPPAA